MTIGVTSDFIGPVPIGSLWDLTISTDQEQTLAIQSWDEPATAAGQHNIHWGFRPGGEFHPGLQVAVSGQNVRVGVYLLEGGTGAILDEGFTNAIWQPSSNEAIVTQAFGGAGTNGAAISSDLAAIQTQLQTLTDAVTLAIPSLTNPLQTLAAALSPTLLDDITLHELSPGITGNFVGANLTALIWGIVIRIATVPPELVPLTPDGDYYQPTLAVVRIFSGSDLLTRVPIHTTSKIIPFQKGFWETAIAAVEHYLWPNSMSLQVTWLAGVTGQVFEMLVP